MDKSTAPFFSRKRPRLTGPTLVGKTEKKESSSWGSQGQWQPLPIRRRRISPLFVRRRDSRAVTSSQGAPATVRDHPPEDGRREEVSQVPLDHGLGDVRTASVRASVPVSCRPGPAATAVASNPPSPLLHMSQKMLPPASPSS